MEDIKNGVQEYIKRRNNDIARTQTVEKFMDWLYEQHGIAIKRITDIRMQKNGVDLTTTIDGRYCCVDEKFAINYWNTDLQTFAFEISTKNNIDGNGWFTNQNLLTTDYLLLWIRSEDEAFAKITNCEALFIDKQVLKNYLKSVNIDIYALPHLLKRHGTKVGKSIKLVINDNLKVVQSLQFEREQPINLIISRKTLRLLAYKRLIYAH